MTPEERKQFIGYMKFKVKGVGLAALFIHTLRQNLVRSDEKAITKHRMKVIYED